MGGGGYGGASCQRGIVWSSYNVWIIFFSFSILIADLDELDYN